VPAGEQGLAVRGLHTRAGAFVLAPVDLTVAADRVLVLLGPSGSGKTTLLDTIAGLHPALGGTVHVGGRDLTALPPQRRDIGVVFQHGALFPHLTVAGNVRFGLRGRSEADSGHATMLMRRLGLERLADRSPLSLSGGEAQRVALARALAIRPGLLLLDEPLSALDLPAREELRGTLQELLAGLALPVVYVTHDRDEALSIGDDIAVLAGGQLRQAGTALEVTTSPADASVARLLGWRLLGRGTVSQGTVSIGQLTLNVTGLSTRAGIADVFYRPEDVVIGTHGSPAAVAGHFTARIERILPTRPLAHISLAGNPAVTVLLLHRQVADLGFGPGTLTDVTFPQRAIHVIAVPGSG
jgi:ABC-type Fe3+/spermidine/putrescine transport system ATPase subunit